MSWAFRAELVPVALDGASSVAPCLSIPALEQTMADRVRDYQHAGAPSVAHAKCYAVYKGDGLALAKTAEAQPALPKERA